MIEDIESKISSLGGEPNEAGVTGDAIAVEDDDNLPEEVTLSDDHFDGLGGIEDERERPSSKNSKIDDDESEMERGQSRDDL